jgi:hypothetical protein
MAGGGRRHRRASEFSGDWAPQMQRLAGMRTVASSPFNDPRRSCPVSIHGISTGEIRGTRPRLAHEGGARWYITWKQRKSESAREIPREAAFAIARARQEMERRAEGEIGG